MCVVECSNPQISMSALLTDCTNNHSASQSTQRLTTLPLSIQLLYLTSLSAPLSPAQISATHLTRFIIDGWFYGMIQEGQSVFSLYLCPSKLKNQGTMLSQTVMSPLYLPLPTDPMIAQSKHSFTCSPWTETFILVATNFNLLLLQNSLYYVGGEQLLFCCLL